MVKHLAIKNVYNISKLATLDENHMFEMNISNFKSNQNKLQK